MPFSCMTFLTRASTCTQQVFLTYKGEGLDAGVTIQAISHMIPAQVTALPLWPPTHLVWTSASVPAHGKAHLTINVGLLVADVLCF